VGENVLEVYSAQSGVTRELDAVPGGDSQKRPKFEKYKFYLLSKNLTRHCCNII